MANPPYNLVAHGFLIAIGFLYQHTPMRLRQRYTAESGAYDDESPAYDLYCLDDIIVSIDEFGLAECEDKDRRAL